MYMLVKTKENVHLKCMHYVICKLQLNKMYFYLESSHEHYRKYNTESVNCIDVYLVEYFHKSYNRNHYKRQVEL